MSDGLVTWKGHEQLRSLLRPMIELRRDPANRRLHGQRNLEAIAASYRRWGQMQPILTLEDGTIMAGNGQHQAAQEMLGWTHLAVLTFTDRDSAREFALVHNRSGELAEWDLSELGRELHELMSDGADVAALGWTEAEVAALVPDDVRADAQAREDEAPPPPAVPVTQPGDLWRLGPHRLLCGDAMVRDDVRRVLAGERAELMLTDPPYGVMHGSASGTAGAAKAIRGDLSQAVIPISFAVALEVALEENARIYTFGGSGNWTMYARLFDHHLHMEPRVSVWVKENFVLRHNGYHSKFEVVYFGWRGEGGPGNCWWGDRTQVDVWEVARDREGLHPTQKPVAVCAIPIGNSCAPGGLVFDPFLGAGSTLVAAQVAGRRCVGLELDPAYCDVICARWQRLTGTPPVHDDTGRAVDFEATW
jgi:hypothetical protein